MGYVAYYRVSTEEQGESGLGLDSQKAIVCNYYPCVDFINEYVEVASGKTINDRPLLQQAINECIEGGHILVVAKVDRLSRKTEHALEIFNELDGWLASCDIPTTAGAKMDKFTLTIFMAIADRERELISIRTKAALAEKKKQGVKLGGKPFSNEVQAMGSVAQRKTAIAEYSKLNNYIKVMREDKRMSFRAIAQQLNADGHKTRTKKKFQATTVKRMYDRL